MAERGAQRGGRGKGSEEEVSGGCGMLDLCSERKEGIVGLLVIVIGWTIVSLYRAQLSLTLTWVSIVTRSRASHILYYQTFKTQNPDYGHRHALNSTPISIVQKEYI